MEVASDREYTDVHRAFVQLILAWRQVDEKVARNALNELITTFPTTRPLNLEIVVRECNEQLEQLGLEISSGMVNDVRVYALVSTISDSIAHHASTMTASQRALTKALVTALAKSRTKTISFRAFLEFVKRSDAKANQKSCSEMLEHLVAHKWLEVVGGDHGNRTYALSLRTLKELDEFIEDQVGQGCGEGVGSAAPGGATAASTAAAGAAGADGAE
mmetsp:Transcript_21300/g.68728  ORF Transcript_21300/g.68728 Transcript_21300/m.68728 type:complete len:217 (+) Transcript_21300:1-651(+)